MKPNETPVLNCEITRDLLPLVVEQLAAPGTAAAVQRHLDSCPECAALYARMASPEPLPHTADASREVDYFKKVRKASRVQVVAAVAVTLAVLLCAVGFKVFWLGTEATREGSSWSVQWTDESRTMQLRAYTNNTAIAYRDWQVHTEEGVVRITARRVTASPLCHDTSEWFTLDLTGVEEVYLFGTLLWQNGVTIFESNLRQYEQRTPYVGSAPEVGEQLAALNVADRCGPFTIQLLTGAQPYGLQLNFTDEYTAKEAKKLNTRMAEIAPKLLALVDNLDYVCWYWTNGTGEFVQRVEQKEVSQQIDAAMARLAALGEYNGLSAVQNGQWPGGGIKWCGQSAAGYQILCDLIQEQQLDIVPELVTAKSRPVRQG